MQPIKICSPVRTRTSASKTCSVSSLKILFGKKCAYGFNFSAKLDDLWQLQLDEYAKEEQTLRVMMEKDKVVRQEKQIPSGLQVNLDQWQIALFGNRKSLDYEYLVHTAAEQDVHSLIYTRLVV
jgi:hypothetical protein